MNDNYLEDEENEVDNSKELLINYLGNNATVHLPKPDELLSTNIENIDPKLVDTSLMEANVNQTLDENFANNNPGEMVDFYALENMPPEQHLATQGLGMSEASPDSWENILDNIYEKTQELTGEALNKIDESANRGMDLLNMGPDLPEDVVLGEAGRKGPGMFSRAWNAIRNKPSSQPQVVVNNPPAGKGLGKIIGLSAAGGTLGAPFVATEQGREKLGHAADQMYGAAVDKVVSDDDLINPEPVTRFGRFELVDRPDLQNQAYKLSESRNQYIKKDPILDAVDFYNYKNFRTKPVDKSMLSDPEFDGKLRQHYGLTNVTLKSNEFNALQKNALNFVDLIDAVGDYARLAGKINFESSSAVHKYRSPPNYQPTELEQLKAAQEKLVTIMGEADLTGVMTDRDIRRVRTYKAAQPGENMETVIYKTDALMEDLERSYRILPDNLKGFVNSKLYEEQARQLLGSGGTIRNGVVYLDVRGQNKVFPMPVEHYLEMKKAQGAPVQMDIFPWKRVTD